MKRQEPCSACGRPTTVGRDGHLREHTRVQYRGVVPVLVRCRGSLEYHPLRITPRVVR